MKCGIYGIKNNKNDKWYIGQTTGVLRTRKNNHFWHLKNGTHRNDRLQKSFNKHGIACYEFSIIELVSEQELDQRERFWIQFYNSQDDRYGYNLETGGHELKHHSKESCQKISMARKGIVFSEETCRRLSVANKGRKLNLTPEKLEARKKQLREANNNRAKESYHSNKGQKWTEKARLGRQIYLAGTPNMPWKGKPWSDARRLAEIKRKMQLQQQETT